MQSSLLLARGNGTSPTSTILAASHGFSWNSPCIRRPTEDTLRRALGPKCWSRSVVPLPVEWGTPTKAISWLVDF